MTLAGRQYTLFLSGAYEHCSRAPKMMGWMLKSMTLFSLCIFCIGCVSDFDIPPPPPIVSGPTANITYIVDVARSGNTESDSQASPLVGGLSIYEATTGVKRLVCLVILR